MSLAVADPQVLAGCGDPSGGRRRRRWALWRSPDGQPAWARPALLGIAAVAALLYAWNMTRAGLAPFYSVAVKSMSESWKAFFYGAFDPKATVTIDKLAGAFVPQALSARIFGFHPWSLALPQVIEGVVTVVVMYRVVRRWAGVVPGLLAAALMAFTPIAASMFGHSMEDGALTMCMVLAADSYQRAVGQARLRSLMWAGFWVGAGFQAKMLEAWMILPALAIGYLVTAPAPLRRRLWQLCAAGAVMLAVSLSWVALYTFTPASDRPYVDGSTNNSAVAMVFGYNGLERFGIQVPGSVTSGPGVGGNGSPGGLRRLPAGTGSTGETGFPGGGVPVPQGSAPGGSSPGGAQFSGEQGGFPSGGLRGGQNGSAPSGTGGSPAARGPGGAVGNGWTKLLGSRFGPEVGWLYPLAVASLVLGLVWRRRAPRIDQVRGGFIMWGIWLATFGIVYSKMSVIPHTAYVAALAPPVAALSAAAIVMLWRLYRAGDRRGWLLPVAVLAELAWAWYLWRSYPGFLPWVPWMATAAGVASIVVLGISKLPQRMHGWLVPAALTAGVAAMLAAPAAWASSVLDARYAGSSFDAGAGPVQGIGGSGGAMIAGPFAEYFRELAGRSGDRIPLPGSGSGQRPGGPGILGSSSTTLTAAEENVYRYVTAHRDGASYLMAVPSWSAAAPYILATSQEVMPMGGFSGSVPAPTLARVKQLVARGQLRFFLLGASGSSPGFTRGSGTQLQAITTWVQSSCAKVPAKAYGGTASTSTQDRGFGGFGDAGAASGTLYECSRSP